MGESGWRLRLGAREAHTLPWPGTADSLLSSSSCPDTEQCRHSRGQHHEPGPEVGTSSYSEREVAVFVSVLYYAHSTAVCTVQIEKTFFHSVSTSIKVKILFKHFIYRFVIFSTTTFHKCFIDDWTSIEEYLDELVLFSLHSD